MKEKFFDSYLDVEKYISDRVLNIKNFSERTIYKDLATNIFIDLYKYHEEKYNELCESIMNEVDDAYDLNPVYIGLTNISKYDETDKFLYPMLKEDLNIKKFTSSDINEALNKGNHFELGKIYIDSDLILLNCLRNDNRIFSANVVTDKGQYKATIKVEIDNSYIEEVAKLYKSFMFSVKKWISICTAYLYRFFKVYITEIDNEFRGEYTNIFIDYREYKGVIKTNIIPLWNINKICEPTSIYPKPIKEGVAYEHKIFAHFLDPDSSYLLTDINPEILSIIRRNQDLIIRTSQDYAIEWDIIEIKKKYDNVKLDNLLSSEYSYKDIDMFLNMYNSSIKTKAELIRFTNNLPFGEYIKFEDFELVNNVDEGFITYDMDEFEMDEIRLKSEQTLILTFSKLKNHMLILDFMSFYVTSIKRIFKEYKCVGKFIDFRG